MHLNDNFQLSFRPLAPWPTTLPAILWKNLRITGFDSTHLNAPCLEVSDRINDLADALKDCYPDLSLSEIARLWKTLSLLPAKYEPAKVWASVAKHYRLRDCEITQNTLKKLLTTSDAFQDWVSRRSLGIRELAILQSLNPVEDFRFLLDRVAHLVPLCLLLFCEGGV